VRIVIRLIAPAGIMENTSPRHIKAMLGQYVESFDPDGNDGRGELKVTRDRQSAKVFKNPGDAIRYWKQQSTVQPLRPDGKENRPLTAWTVATEALLS